MPEIEREQALEAERKYRRDAGKKVKGLAQQIRKGDFALGLAEEQVLEALREDALARKSHDETFSHDLFD